MAIKPLGDRILVKPLEAEEKSKGGIILPDTAKNKPREGKVVAVGAGKLLKSGETKKPEVKTGDKVLYGEYAGSEITYKEEEYLVLKEDEILAIL